MGLFDFLKKSKVNKEKKCAVVIVAAGNSSRMGTDKTMMELNGIPVIVRNVRAFDNIDSVSEIVLVTKQDSIEKLADIVKQYDLSKVTKVIAGGNSRTESSFAGVSNVNAKADLIAIHDGARPFITEDLINNCIKAAEQYRAAVPGIKCVDTMKYVDNEFIAGDIDRNNVIRIQSPQVFDADLIKGALTNAVEKMIVLTDDSSAVELMGVKVRVVQGDVNNIKLTTPDDVKIGLSILESRGEKI